MWWTKARGRPAYDRHHLLVNGRRENLLDSLSDLLTFDSGYLCTPHQLQIHMHTHLETAVDVYIYNSMMGSDKSCFELTTSLQQGKDITCLAPTGYGVPGPDV